MSIAWVFPGQGSQKLGMADELLVLENAKERFEMASNLMKRDLLAICKGESENKDSQSELNKTINTQPALFVVESLIVDNLIKQHREASLVAGHSLGEIVALYAAGVFDFEVGIKLIIRRAELMSSCQEGSMTAIMGFKREKLESLIKITEDAFIANDNSSGQVVISGKEEALKEITKKLECKRSIPLPVSGAFHSPFMENAANEFAKELDKVTFKNSRIPVLSNSDPKPTCDGNLLKKRLKSQMINGVRWREIMNEIADAGITTVVEIGPGNVLSGLIKRSLQGINTSQLSNAKDLGY